MGGPCVGKPVQTTEWFLAAASSRTGADRGHRPGAIRRCGSSHVRRGLLRDVEYEYYRMGSATQDWFREVFPDAAWTADRAYLRRQRDRLVILRNERPVDGGFFARELRKNREIIEAWMPWSPELRRQLYTDLDARYNHQIAQMAARTDLSGRRYAWWRSNCTQHIREALAVEAGGEAAVAGSVFPMRNLTALRSAR